MMQSDEGRPIGCDACDILEDYSCQHGYSVAFSTIKPYNFHGKDILMMASTTDIQLDGPHITNKNPKEQDPHFDDLKEMDENVEDNSEGDSCQSSRTQLIPQNNQNKLRKGRPGARNKKGRDLNTFFWKMRKWIADHTETSSSLPNTIRFKNLDHILKQYREEAISFLLPLAEEQLPGKPTTISDRNDWHRRCSFKKRAQEILWERLKFSQGFPF